jgi:hypothetical protein
VSLSTRLPRARSRFFPSPPLPIPPSLPPRSLHSSTRGGLMSG